MRRGAARTDDVAFGKAAFGTGGQTSAREWNDSSFDRPSAPTEEGVCDRRV